MQIYYPAGYTEEDFKAGRRISGVQLMEQTGLSLPEIQARGIQAFKEIVDKPKPPLHGSKEGRFFGKLLAGLTMRRIILFFPESIDDMPNCFYLLRGVEEMEESNSDEAEQTPLTKSEKQELGRLRKEKEKWDESISASVSIGIWLTELKYKITHKELEAQILKAFPDIPKSTINKKIWEAIPEDYKNTGGAKKQPQ